MLKSRVELKAEAKQFVIKNFATNTYWHMVLASLIYFVLNRGFRVDYNVNDGNVQASVGAIRDVSALVAVIGIIGFLFFLALAIAVSVFGVNPLVYGIKSYFRHLPESQPDRMISIFQSPDYYPTTMKLFKKNLTIFLYTLLLVVPGIIKIYEFYFVDQLIEDHPELSGDEILSLSKNMMNGHKMDMFIYDLSWIGWAIVGSLFYGLPNLLFVIPYRETTTGLMYNDYLYNSLDSFSSQDPGQTYTDTIG